MVLPRRDPSDQTRLESPLVVSVPPESLPTPDTHWHVPSGVYPGVCVDVWYRGIKTTDYGDKPIVRFVWQIQARHEETGRRLLVARNFVRSLTRKSSLRRFLVTWRGVDWLEEELRTGVDLESDFHGRNGHLVIEQIAGRPPFDEHPLSLVRWCYPRDGSAPFLLPEGYVRIRARGRRRAVRQEENDAE